MIRLSSTGQEEIKQDIFDFLKDNADKYPVFTGYAGSTQNQLLDMASGVAAYLAYKYMFSQRETSLSTCVLQESRYLNAWDMGYNINRTRAPQVSLRYSGAEKLVIRSGDIFGTFPYRGLSYDLIYFGTTRTLFQNDTFQVAIGKFGKVEGSFLQMDFNKTVALSIYPDVGQTIDDAQLKVYVNDVEKEWVDDGQDFLTNPVVWAVTRHPLDTSKGIGIEATFWVPTLSYGLEVLKTDEYRIEYISSAGRIPQLADITSSASMKDSFDIFSVLSEGANEEDASQVKTMAPLYAVTAGRAVTEKDYSGILSKHAFIFSAKYLGYGSQTVSLSYVGHTGEPLTPYELEEVALWVQKKGLAGITAALIPSTPKVETLLVSVLYRCDSRRTVDSISAFETGLETELIKVFNKYAGRQEITVSLKELYAEMDQISMNETNPIRRVNIQRVKTDGTLESVPESYVFSTTKEEAYRFSLKFELSC